MADAEQHLWETPSTGPLDPAGYSVQPGDPTNPSLSGAYTGPGAASASHGIGGSQTGPSDHVEPLAPPKAVERQMTPAELMSSADAIQRQFQFEPGPSSVQPAIDHANVYQDANAPPDWLAKYMESTPTTGTYSIDRLGHQKYSADKERLKKLKALR